MTDLDYEEQLVAYLDGELNEREAINVETALAENQELRGRLSMLCRQRFMLAEMFQVQGATQDKTDTSQIDTPTKKIIRKDFSHKTTQKAAAVSGTRKNNSVGQKRTSRHKKDQSKQRLTFFAGIAAALLIGVYTYFNFVPESPADPVDGPAIVFVDDLPIVGYKQGEITWTQDYKIGEQLRNNDVVTLSDTASLTLTYNDGSILVLDKGARFDVRSKKRIYLHGGHVQATVRKQQQGQTLAVHTDAGHIEVVGTQFSVLVSGDSALTTVREGIVKVTSALNKQSYLVHALEGCSLHATDLQQIHQYITGKVTDISDGKGWKITIQTSQGEKTFTPQWTGGEPHEGGGADKDVIKQLRRIREGNQARIRWSNDGERPRVLQAERIDD